MTSAGIICEFDPFHNGHGYLIEKVRDAGAESVVCVMSGDYTQRGAPAMWDKFRRAEAAVLCGADLVLELPALYAVNSADLFARGGVRILSGLGCVDTLAFGSECADQEKLSLSARVTAEEPEQYSARLKEHLSEGLSYAASCQKALAELYSPEAASVLNGPNDILAVCYMREIILQKVGLSPFAVKRTGADHKAQDPDGCFASAGAIRKAAASGEDIRDLIPEKSLSVISDDDRHPDNKLFYEIARHRILTSGSGFLKDIPEVSEGLEMRMIQAAQCSEDLDSFLENVSTRRYPAPRIRRILSRIILGIDSKKQACLEINRTAYAKVLAFGPAGAKILKTASEKGTVGIVSNVNKYVPKDAAEEISLGIDILSGDIYNMLCGRTLTQYSDRVRIPEIILK